MRHKLTSQIFSAPLPSDPNQKQINSANFPSLQGLCAPETLLCAGAKGLRAGALQQDRPGGEAGKRAPLQPGDLGSHALACCPVWVQGETLHVKHRAGVQRPHTEC